MVSVSAVSPLLAHAENATYACVCAFVDELQRAGIRNVVVCPGSRSTPLALAFAAQPNLHVWMHIDERSAAFFALGMAKRSTTPVALLCTSGTAAANFFPAIVEAKLTHVPLLVLTSDRPHELRENGAPQTIDQTRLYGSHVKWSVDMALPEATNIALRYNRITADRAVALTTALPAGPVHLNIPLREPLTPAPIAGQLLPPESQRDTNAWLGRPDNALYTRVHENIQGQPDSATVALLVERIQQARHGLIIVGPQEDTALVAPLLEVAQLLEYPLLADPLSQMRSMSTRNSENIFTSYDAFLRVDAFTEKMQPDLILRFGAMPISKPVLTYLKHYSSRPLIVIDGSEDWQEPTQLASELLHTNPVALCQVLSTLLKSGETRLTTETPRSWLATWQRADAYTREALQATIQDFTSPFEGRVFTELASLLPENALLYVGNSMPVRDLDTFFWGGNHEVRIMGNRGANGIDGIVSSALGASAAADSANVLVLGDLSFFHDMNGLLAARLHKIDLTIVLVNNDGGGIFSFLPQAEYPEHFEQLFGTPTALDFSHAAHLYGAHYQRVDGWDLFRDAVQYGIRVGGLHIVEVTTERASNVRMHRELWQHVTQVVTSVVAE